MSQNKGQLYTAYQRKIQKRYKKVKKFKMAKTCQTNTNNGNFNIEWKETLIVRLYRKKLSYNDKIFNP